MKSFTFFAIATLATTAAALAAPNPGSVFERPVAVPVDQNDSFPAIQQQGQLPAELPPATIPTITAVSKSPCKSPTSLPTATAVAADESQYSNPIQQLPIITAIVTARVTSAAAAPTSSALPTVAPVPTPTDVPRKRKCIRYRVKPAAPTATATAIAEDVGYGSGGKPGKTDVAFATAPAMSTATAAATNVYEQPPAGEPVAKNELGESSNALQRSVGQSGAAALVLMVGAGLFL
ncbi:hypothetical protein BCR44DRAFT_89481 [Catenaria anguillulae PL171]|uniref:Uncharacterized protein n=1 Tax=Catenaria anguillulae PL171 TaxID=765915 RepID=A0A1Y2HUG6_9FUNG|nr:hypothetical protein BCR44DRAFT_89481 [Catenaria anguillulae PL171]